ncbi:MAG: CRTAC1 family protein, partial [Gammaproteobacteria bacterium]|nr:CRTAC1 family protein [Gammaproteobacteria bacterium]
DGDGDLDLYLVQGHMLGNKNLSTAVFPPQHPVPLSDRLYQNQLEGGRLRFTDVTRAAGVEIALGYGMGAASGDIDNDGDPDLYITNFGDNQLLLNTGGRFRDATAEYAVNDRGWSVSAAFADIDGDSWLDLYVGNYVDYDLANPRICLSAAVVKEYCGPASFTVQPDSLFVNEGGKRYSDQSTRSGIRAEFGGALGVISADFNGDHQPDLYVANDGVPNQLWINQGKRRFVNDAMLAGVAVNMSGAAEASMGVDAADFDGDGDVDLFMTHLTRETNTLYVNDGTGLFEDRTVAAGLANPSLPFTGFGTGWRDFDNDGDLDLLLVNGAVYRIESQVLAGEAHPLKETNQLFENLGNGRFREITASAGPVFQVAEVSRGALFGDLDNDGDTDVVITNNGGAARVWRNRIGQDNAWLGLRLVEHQRDAYGARAGIVDATGRLAWRRVHSDGSYAVANDPRVRFGLGTDAAPRQVTVIWPGGTREVFSNLATGRYHVLHRGQGDKP